MVKFWRRSFAFFTALFLSFAADAACFRPHLEEAIALNQERRSLYGEASGGKSLAISDALIAMEHWMISTADLGLDTDAYAAKYEEKGVRITCDSYVPMSGTASFLPAFPEGPVKEADEKVRSSGFKDQARLWWAYLTGGNAGLVKESEVLLGELFVEPRVNCLMRHFVESAARVAAFAPIHAKQAEAAGLSSPWWIHSSMIVGHLFLLPKVQSLDKQARALQMSGLPIICRDVPPIPLP